MNKTVGFHYGALHPTLEHQANEQHLTLSEHAESLERSRTSITWLFFRDILTDSQTNDAYMRLNKQVFEHLRPLEGGKIDAY